MVIPIICCPKKCFVLSFLCHIPLKKHPAYTAVKLSDVHKPNNLHNAGLSSGPLFHNVQKYQRRNIMLHIFWFPENGFNFFPMQYAKTTHMPAKNSLKSFLSQSRLHRNNGGEHRSNAQTRFIALDRYQYLTSRYVTSHRGNTSTYSETFSSHLSLNWCTTT